MNDHNANQSIVDGEHLRLLSLGYIISGVMSALFSLMGLFYALMGLVMNQFFAAIANDSNQTMDVPPEFMGAFMGIFGGLLFLVVFAMALAKFWAASQIRKRKSRVGIQVVAAISCFGIPYGTMLGVCTFMVLGRSSVMQLFEAETTL